MQKAKKIAEVKAARGKDAECPTSKYTTRGAIQGNNDGVNIEARLSLGTYGNGWSEQGCQRYCELMNEVNESRAFYKDSFDLRMKKFATTWVMKEKNRRRKKQAAMFDMALEFNLPNHATIVQEANNQAAQSLNETLKSHEDALPIEI